MVVPVPLFYHIFANMKDRFSLLLCVVIVLKIRADFPELSEVSIRLLCLIISGFKDPAIATIMNKSISAVSTRKSRLRKQILEADTPNHELYEAFLK